jgi:hypothetical protein
MCILSAFLYSVSILCILSPFCVLCLIVLLCVLFVCKCVLGYCHRDIEALTTTLVEVSPCFFLSCNANARV